VPASGATLSNLEVQLDAAAAGSGNTVDVVNNGTGAVLFSCTVTAGNTTCTNTGTASVAAGVYLEVKVTNNTGAANRKYRVTFRY